MNAPSGRPGQPRKSPWSSMQHGRKQARFHGKTDKTGGTAGRPSCQSSLLSDPNATFSVEMWRKPASTRKVKTKKRRDVGTDVPNAKKTEIKPRRAATSALTFMTFS